MIKIDIDTSNLQPSIAAIGLTQKEIDAAAHRAYQRTAKDIKRLVLKALSRKLETRNSGTLRRRIRLSKRNGVFSLFVGLNDMPVGALKGKMKQISSGVVFRGQRFDGAFIAKMPNGKQSAWRRRNKNRNSLVEVKTPIQTESDEAIRREIYDDVVELFRYRFENDLKGRMAKKAAKL